jgi:hypothetical protein
MEPQTLTPSTCKVRRDVLEGKRGDGHHRSRRIRRPDARQLVRCESERTLTGVGGLAAFGAFVRELGLDRELRQRFGRLKSSPWVIYPMEAQMRLLLDAAVAGEERVFGLEALAGDPLFVHLAGGVVPSLDTVYRDLQRFDTTALVDLERMVGEQGLSGLRGRQFGVVHLDIDTTVLPLFGSQQGALPGPNPHYHARPSYHPVVARLAETGTFVGACLRPGDTSFGAAEIPWIEMWIDRVRAVVGPTCVIYVRIDGAADCTALLMALARKGVFFVTKADMTADLCGAVATVSQWTTVDWDADGRPRRQVAQVRFLRNEWAAQAVEFRVLAVRTRDRPSGKQIFLWKDLEYTVQVYLTNEWFEEADDVAHRYNLRAGIEPMIGEAKYAWGIGKVPSQCFEANHATLLLKLLAFNLLRRFAEARAPELKTWRTPWLRRVLILVPGRLCRSGRHRTLRLPIRPTRYRWLN